MSAAWVGYSDHFLTLPDRRTLTIPEGADSWEVFTAHAIAALGEGLCAWCASPLSTARECRDGRHPPCRWHVCPTGYGQVMLDAIGSREPGACIECGKAM